MADLNEGQLLQLVQVLGADVSGTMLRDATKAAPQLGSLVHALGCAFAGRLAVDLFRSSIETDEQAAEFERLLARVLDHAATTAALGVLRHAAGHGSESGNG